MDVSDLFIRIILAYSMYTNGLDILRTTKKEGEVDCLHGIRFLSMCWIILGHTYYYIGTSLTTDNLIPTLINFPRRFYTQVIVQAPLAVDSFFLLSGMLASYIFFKKLIKDKTIRNVQNPLMWVVIYIKRYTSSSVEIASMMFSPFQCMGWTWYLANDVQLHYIVAPILFIAFAKYVSLMNMLTSFFIKTYIVAHIRNFRWGLLLASVMMICSSTIKLWIIFQKDFPPAPILTAKLQIVKKLDEYWNDVYVRPYVRCGPFIVGVVVGYLLNKLTCDRKDNHVKIPKKWVALGWSVSTILGLYSVFGLYNYAQTGDISEWWKGLYVVAGRHAYAVTLGWIAFACSTGNGGPVATFLSWKFFMPLSKITFCAYLLHPIMLQIYNFSRPQPFHFTTFFQMLQHTSEAIFVSYLVAFFFALAFEKPFTVFDEMLIPVKFRTSAKPKSIELRTSNGEAEPLKA
ncbi:hypothetical protein NECAME_17304 [Necator americanus]|uniref:Acyltransferase 3 domain-containing protein n=1 Tax=Necator americanus TaxID=51031 RepID=W2TS89_NECAM|nr:hypothetical protein NECAME_17304 [Necator americanus]ETN83981.1 hypothetical protein NECAME_17304 [Necator americanus]